MHACAHAHIAAGSVIVQEEERKRALDEKREGAKDDTKRGPPLKFANGVHKGGMLIEVKSF